MPRCTTALLMIISLAGICLAADQPDDVTFFEKRIRPVLVEHCYECHAADAKKVRGGLLVDSREAIRNGGDSGPGVVPGVLEESLVLDALRHESFEMPPDGRLPDHVIKDFEAWIEAGAVDPRDASTSIASDEFDWEHGRDFWSFQLPTKTQPPTLQAEAIQNPIDAFLRAAQDAKGITPLGQASKATLLRRAYYALIGLPPSPDELQAYLDDDDPQAFERVVDRLLQSQHFGERWGRHWLDVVRFAESSGGGRTLLFPEAWRYRDYVIDAFNADMPYDQFIREQLAGDLIAEDVDRDDWQARQRLLVATSFLLLGPTNYELQDKDVLEMDIVDEQLDTIGKSFLGMTIGCARCHDHKFDPIPTEDYYAMAGILKSTKSVIHDNVSSWNTVKLPLPKAEQERLEAQEAKRKKIEAELAKLKKQKKTADKKNKDGAAAKELAKQIKEVEQQLAQHKKSAKPWPRAMATQDAARPDDIPIAIRGIVSNRGSMVPRGVMQVALKREFPKLDGTLSGRRQFADWVADPQNPLTARVFVNRVWYWLFGEGLVRTVDNFGAMGETPSHPELLDYLAVQFVEDGYSIKRLIRRIMLSRSYQLTSQDHAGNAKIDPDNRLWWRMHRRRIEAESLRDTLMHLAGTLDLRVGGSNIKPGTKIEYNYKFNSNRRSVYVPVFRNTLPPIFSAFDFADPNTQAGKRTTSTIAPQALLLMNDPWVVEQFQHAGSIVANQSGDVEQRIVQCFRRILTRSPSPHELQLAKSFLQASDEATDWALLIQTLVQSIDFRYIP